jgi:hypothetical protein
MSVHIGCQGVPRHPTLSNHQPIKHSFIAYPVVLTSHALIKKGYHINVGHGGGVSSQVDMSTFTYPHRDNIMSTPMLTSTAPEVRISSQELHFDSEASLVPFENPPSVHTRNQSIWRRIKTILKVLILLFLSIGYLAFCYTVKYRTVPLRHLGPFSITRNNLGQFFPLLRYTES